jgi:tRNA(Arg) A34 adenosine deaminase TadA
MSADNNWSQEQQDAHFMDLALRQAEAAARTGQTPFGAVVLDPEGRLVGEGHNTVRADLDPTAHGEIVALRAAWRRLGAWEALAGATLYSSCEPCLLCSFVIMQIGVRRVVFAARGTDVPGYKPLLGADLTDAAAWVSAQSDWARLEVVGDFMRDHALRIIAAFPWAQARTRTAVEGAP